MYCDSHAHLTSSSLFEQLDAVIAAAQAAGVNQIINICTDKDSLEKGILLSKQHPWISNTAATHPHDAEAEGEQQLPFFTQAARNGDIVAIGETGLDYHYNHSSKEMQQKYLRSYLQLALEYRLPVVIHCREAFADFFKILDEEYMVNSKHAPGVLHCFTGTLEEAKQVLKRGWYLSLSGIVTFKKSEELRDVAKLVPLDRLLIETDAPYLAPQSFRGKPNQPAYLPETAAAVASAKGLSVEKLAAATYQNTCALFKL
jgi:TatD DNase family protein